MRYENEVGYRALGLYAEHEHVSVAKDLLSLILKQIDANCTEDGLDEVDVADHVVAGLVQIVMDVADDNGYHKLMHDIQDLAVENGLSHLI
jgi:hypothetical protein